MIFEEEQWKHDCEKIAKDSYKRCGLSHDYYVEIFSSEIDNLIFQFSDEDKKKAVSIARFFDYADILERKESQEWNANNGYCEHGIELGCCPAGCGSY